MNKKKLLLNLLNSELETCHGEEKIQDKHITAIDENRFRVETIRPAIEENKKKHGPNLPDDRIMSEYQILTDDEAANPPSGDPGDIIKGGISTEAPEYKAYRIA